MPSFQTESNTWNLRTSDIVTTDNSDKSPLFPNWVRNTTFVNDLEVNTQWWTSTQQHRIREGITARTYYISNSMARYRMFMIRICGRNRMRLQPFWGLNTSWGSSGWAPSWTCGTRTWPTSCDCCGCPPCQSPEPTCWSCALQRIMAYALRSVYRGQAKATGSAKIRRWYSM